MGSHTKYSAQRQIVFLPQIVEDVPDVDVVVVPVGGAGLIAGVSLAVKTLKPECRVRIQKRQQRLASPRSPANTLM